MPPVAVDAERIRREASILESRLHRYTPRQLYYAVCASLERPPIKISRAQFGFGMVLIVAGLCFVRILPPLTVVLGVLGALSLAAGVRSRSYEAARLHGRALALSFTDFVQLVAAAGPLEGMVDPDLWVVPRRLPAAARPIVVCDTPENAATVQLILERERIPAVVMSYVSLRARAPGRRIVAVHDADPRGCALPLALGDDGARVYDAGLRPRDVMALDLQLIHGAPARMPRDLSTALSAEEIDWLRSGTRLELAAFPEEAIARLIRQGLEELAREP